MERVGDVNGKCSTAGGPFRKQRWKEPGKDGMHKQGEQHNEHKNLEGSLSKAGAFLQRADDLEDYKLKPGMANLRT